ncbi:hypothetical protein HDV05_006092 [Chytridiales sp. JEL 0842]|nr:hypothetical protein HDV05_006092 [Chytridiales sp. JEL 0842]
MLTTPPPPPLQKRTDADGLYRRRRRRRRSIPTTNSPRPVSPTPSINLSSPSFQSLNDTTSTPTPDTNSTSVSTTPLQQQQQQTTSDVFLDLFNSRTPAAIVSLTFMSLNALILIGVVIVAVWRCHLAQRLKRRAALETEVHVEAEVGNVEDGHRHASAVNNHGNGDRDLEDALQGPPRKTGGKVLRFQSSLDSSTTNSTKSTSSAHQKPPTPPPKTSSSSNQKLPPTPPPKTSPSSSSSSRSSLTTASTASTASKSGFPDSLTLENASRIHRGSQLQGGHPLSPSSFTTGEPTG